MKGLIANSATDSEVEKVFILIDRDRAGEVTPDEIAEAVQRNEVVQQFFRPLMETDIESGERYAAASLSSLVNVTPGLRPAASRHPSRVCRQAA
eukprot:301760-Hanusia_phi.AAC.4